MQIAVECLKPFSLPQAPKISLSFSCGRESFRVPLTLPVTVSSFFEPMPLDKATYMTRWKALEGADREAQEVFSSGRPVTAELVAGVRGAMFSALRIAPATELDNDFTATGCATLKTGNILFCIL